MKTTCFTGATITIEVPEPNYLTLPTHDKYTVGKMAEWSKELIKMIRRRVDELADCPIDYEMTVVSTCEKCGSPWTEKSEVYNGGCCEADEQHAPQVKAET